MKSKLTAFEQYQKLLQARNRFGLGCIFLILSIVLLYQFLNTTLTNQGLAFVLTMIFGIFGFLIVVFGFSMKDICPWCKQHFFLQGGGGMAKTKVFSYFSKNTAFIATNPKMMSVIKQIKPLKHLSIHV